MALATSRNPDGTITLRHETQTWNPGAGGMDIEVHGEIVLGEQDWLLAVEQVLTAIQSGPEGTPGSVVGQVSTQG